MKPFTFSVLILAISLSVFAGDASRNFSESRIFSESVPRYITASDPKIQVQRSSIVQGQQGEGIETVQTARNTQTGQFLFAWRSAKAGVKTIKAKLLNAQGNVTPGGELSLTVPQRGFLAVAYNPKSNEFLMAYDNLFESAPFNGSVKASVFFQRLDAAGKVIGTAKAFASDPNVANFSPKITFNPKTGGYTILWDREDGMVGQLLTDKAEPDGPVVMIHRFSNAFFQPLQVAYQPSGDKLLAVYTVPVLVTTAIESCDYYFATLDPLLKNVAKSNLMKINGAPVERKSFWYAGLAFLPDLTGLLIYGDNDFSKRRQIDVKGKLKGTSAPAFNSPEGVSLGGSTVAFSTNAKGTFGLLVGGQKFINGEQSTWAQVLDSKGLPMGTAVKFIPGGVANVVPDTFYTLPNKPTDSFSRFVNFGYPDERTDHGLMKAVWKVIVP